MKFCYEGFDSRGTVKRGQIEASSLESASERLREFGIIPQVVEPESGNPPRSVLPGGETRNFTDDTSAPARQPDPAPPARTWDRPASIKDMSHQEMVARVQAAKADLTHLEAELTPTGAWKAKLDKDLAMASEVIDYLKSGKNETSLPLEALKAGVIEASTALVKEAIAKAVRSRIAEG